jgi:hypothetical protein
MIIVSIGRKLGTIGTGPKGGIVCFGEEGTGTKTTASKICPGEDGFFLSVNQAR